MKKKNQTIKSLPARALAFIKRVIFKRGSKREDVEAAPVEEIKNNIRAQPVSKTRYAQGGLNSGAAPIYSPPRKKLKGYQKQKSTFNKNR